MRTVRGAIAGLLACALVVTTTGGTVEAAVSVEQVGGSELYMVDMTPDGRYVLLGSDGGEGPVRVDRQTGRKNLVPFKGELSSNGAYVFGIVPDPSRVTRYNVATGGRRTIPVRAGWYATAVTINDNGSRIGVVAHHHTTLRTGAFIVNALTGRARRIDTLVRGRGQTLGPVSELTLSADGRVATFNEAHLTGGGTDVFVYRQETNKVYLASRAWNGKRTYTGHSIVQDISGDGRFVLFWSDEKGLIKGYGSKPRYYLRDRAAGRTIHLRIPASTYPSPGAVPAAINHNGRRIAFPLEGSIRFGGRNHRGPVVGYLNRDTGRVIKLMKTINSRPPNNILSPFGPLTMDAYGVQVGFSTRATNLTRQRGHGVRGYVSTVR